MSYLWPVSLIKKMEAHIRNFIWSGDIDKNSGVKVRWKQCCLPFHLGGLGIKNLRLFNQALQTHLAWKILNAKSGGLRFILDRFRPSFHNNYYTFLKSSIWPSIRNSLLTLTSNGHWLAHRNSSLCFWIDNWTGGFLIDYRSESVV